MEVSPRQASRLLSRYRDAGAAALAHGNRGRALGYTLPETLRTRVLSLAQGTYWGRSDTHLVELLEERGRLHVS